MATIKQSGRTIDYTPGTAVTAGDVIVQGELVGVAPNDIAANALGALCIEGVVEFAKSTAGSSAITAGALVYYDTAEGEIGEDDESAANKLAGKTIAASVDADAVQLVLLTP